MESVVLQPLTHHNQECIGIFYANRPFINNILKKECGAKWSQSIKCWYLPCTGEAYRQLKNALCGKALIDAQPLRRYLEQKQNNLQHFQAASATPQPKGSGNSVRAGVDERNALKAMAAAGQGGVICDVNSHVIVKLRQALVLKAYSSSTIRIYLGEMRQFLYSIKRAAADDFTVGRIKDYLQYCAEKLHLGENTMHSRINALKFYYEQVLGREKFFWDIPRPKKKMILPNILAERELERLFASIVNLKHKALLFTAYSAGLRVSEVVNLQLKDIDSGRMQIKICEGKGKKDRYVGLSVLLLDILRAYIKKSTVKPVTYLFESEKPGVPYSKRSAQAIFQQARQKAAINKQVSFHCLRHSFATHLLEKGIDIKYIKDLLGHFSIKTTERYLHVKKEDLIVIINPLDELYKNKNWEC